MPTHAGNRWQRDALRDALANELAARGHHDILDRLVIEDNYQVVRVRIRSRTWGDVRTDAPAWDPVRAVLDDITEAIYGPTAATVPK